MIDKERAFMLLFGNLKKYSGKKLSLRRNDISKCKKDSEMLNKKNPFYVWNVPLLSFRTPVVLITALVGFIVFAFFVFRLSDQYAFWYWLNSFESAPALSPTNAVSAPVTDKPTHFDKTALSAPTAGPLRVSPDNPRYFVDVNGQIVYLTGSHTWQNLIDHGQTNPPPVFDNTAYLDFLEAHNHNFFRLWSWEQTKYAVWDPSPNFTFAQSPFQRTGIGTANDGLPKFDLDKFDQTYFDRMRQRIQAARDRGIYVSVMLFNGWSPIYPKGNSSYQNSWVAHPFNAANNINGIDGDLNGDNNGVETHEWHKTNPAWDKMFLVQQSYVRKVIDTVNDLDNVLFEISNESNNTSATWQYYMIDYVKSYEATKPFQHPVGMTVEYPDGNNSVLFNSPADWISPNGSLNPPVANGSKVILADTDHLCGICGNRQWVWKSFMQGENPIFMDGNDGADYGWNPGDAQWDSLRSNLGYTLAYARRINLAAMNPRADLCSTGYCLANPVSPGAEYLVYQPNSGSFSVNLSATSGSLLVEWFNPATGSKTSGGSVNGNNGSQFFTPPFSGDDAVLYLYQETPLTVTNVSASVLDTSAVITWQTNKPSTSQVLYGISPNMDLSTTEKTTLVTSHSVLLTGLLPNITYAYSAISRDLEGQVDMGESTFTTLDPADVTQNYLPIILKQ